MADDLPVMNESDFNAQFGGAANIPTINESDFNKLSIAQNPTNYTDIGVGALKGIAQAGSDVLTAPADFLTHAGNSALNYLTGNNIDPTGMYPSDWVHKFLDSIDSAPSGAQGNKTAEAATHIVGDLGTALAVPSQATNIAENIPGLSKLADSSAIASLFAKAIGYGTEGAAYGELGNPKGDLTQNAELGGVVGVAAPGIASIFGKLADYLPGGASRVATRTAQDVADKIRSVVPDALTQEITPAERAIQGSYGLENTGIAEHKMAGNAFDNLPAGNVTLDTATQNIKDYAEQLSGPIVPGGRVSQLINYLEKLKPADQTVNIPASTILDASGNPIIAASTHVVPGGPAVVPINQFQNILRDVGTIGSGAQGAETAIIAHAKDQLLNAGIAHLPKTTQQALQDARAGWRTMAQTFEEGGVAKAREAVTDPNKGALALKQVLLGDPKGAQQVASVMLPHEIANAQNLMLSDLLKMQPVSWARKITSKIDNFNSVFGEEGTQNLLDMVSRDGTIGKKLLTDNTGLTGVLAKTALKGALGTVLGEAVDGHKGGAVGGLVGLGLAARGNSVTRVQQLLMRAAAGEPGALAILNAPASQFPAMAGKVASLLATTTQKENPRSLMASPANPQNEAQALAAIKADPYKHALAMTESSMDPNAKAKGPDTHAAGIFQFEPATAKAVGLDDPFSVAKSLVAVTKLTDSNAQVIGSTDPELLYAAHVVGAGTVKKVLNHEKLSTDEAKNWDYFIHGPLQNFQKNYKSVTT